MLIGISGLAGSGKDTGANILVGDFSFAKLAFADPMKRIVRDVYNFSEEQLWGPSDNRNQPDRRYPRKRHTWLLTDRTSSYDEYSCRCCGLATKVCHQAQVSSVLNFLDEVNAEVTCYLTPRYALQILGSEFGRECYPNTWADYCIRTAKTLLAGRTLEGVPRYDRTQGIYFDQGSPTPGVVVSDVRFRNEIEALQRAGGKVIRVLRPDAGLKGAKAHHSSEAEQLKIPDSTFDCVVNNDSSISALQHQVAKVVKSWYKAKT